MLNNFYDVVIVGAGAAGLMCAMTAAERGRTVLLIEHSKKTGEKIRISGGGRCNFTNIYCCPEAFLSHNPHFCKSALSQYTQWDFIDLIQKHNIAYHEKTLGQLFCDNSAQDIINMFVTECQKYKVTLSMETSVQRIEKTDADEPGYKLQLDVRGKGQSVTAQSLVIATGGLSIPKIGASRFGYDIARQFDLRVLDTRPALVPLTFQAQLLEQCQALSGLSVDAVVTCGKTSFREGLLFTHRGLSGPSILQISSYWDEGLPITVNLLPDQDLGIFLSQRRSETPKQDVKTVLSDALPARLAASICGELGLHGQVAQLSADKQNILCQRVHQWSIKPSGTEGYRTAEVTRQGVDTDHFSSKTMECKSHKGLYMIGEVLDVTGWLGGYNFQWAWSSASVAGRHV
jgi:hypothetical protein